MQSIRDSDNSRIATLPNPTYSGSSGLADGSITLEWRLALCHVKARITPDAICALELDDTTKDQSPLTQTSSITPLPPPKFGFIAKLLEERLLADFDLADIPIQPQGTKFQMLVWNHLRCIPRGKVQTYSEIAEAIGNPRAVRAVANACACNAIAVAIPCHRVIRSDGSLGGYRWGTALKKRLLAVECSLSAAQPRNERNTTVRLETSR